MWKRLDRAFRQVLTLSKADLLKFEVQEKRQKRKEAGPKRTGRTVRCYCSAAFALGSRWLRMRQAISSSGSMASSGLLAQFRN